MKTLEKIGDENSEKGEERSKVKREKGTTRWNRWLRITDTYQIAKSERAQEKFYVEIERKFESKSEIIIE